MKITIEIADKLLIAAKKRAAKLGQTLGKLVEDSLRWQLSNPHRPRAPKSKKVRWVISKGGVPPGVDVSSRVSLHDWIDKRTTH